jgi:cytochrome c biogenesis protein CcmG, thiol:disulfide interchange protein DsbE
MPRTNRLFTTVAISVAALLVWSHPRWSSAGLEPGEQAPRLRVRTATGGMLDTSALQGRVVVLNFWASYCAPCRIEAPLLQQLSIRIRSRGGLVIGLAVEAESLSEAQQIARQWGMRFPIALASRGTLTAYGVRSLPSTVVIGRDGRVAASFEGALNQAQLDRAVATALSR